MEENLYRIFFHNIILSMGSFWYIICRFIVCWNAIQPLWLLQLKSSFIAFIFTVIPPISKVARRNFFRVYPCVSRIKRLVMVYKYFEAYMDFFYEKAKMTRYTRDEIFQHVTISGVKLLESLVQEHKFVLCYAGHLVNFEILTTFPLFSEKVGMCHLYLAAPNNSFLEWMLSERAKFGAINISSANPMRTLIHLRDELNMGGKQIYGYVFGSLSDLDPKQDDKHSAPFLHYKLEVKTGAEKIARKWNMGFCYAKITRPRRGYYNIQISEIQPLTDPSTDQYAYTDTFVHLLEQNILEQPELWMQWGACRF